MEEESDEQQIRRWKPVKEAMRAVSIIHEFNDYGGKTMTGIIDCRNCIHERPLKDGWKFCCDAFPEGTPLGFEFGLVKEKKECNNGIGYEEETGYITGIRFGNIQGVHGNLII